MNPSSSEVRVMLRAPDPVEPPGRPMLLAQRVQLLDAFAEYQRRHEFLPGSLVAEKDGLVTFNRARAGAHAWIFWRMLDRGDAHDLLLLQQDASRSGQPDIDCILATPHDEGHAVVFTLHASRALRPLQGDERVELERFLSAADGPGAMPDLADTSSAAPENVPGHQVSPR